MSVNVVIDFCWYHKNVKQYYTIKDMINDSGDNLDFELYS